MAEATGEVTQILLEARGGSQMAIEKLMTVVYQELRHLAQYYMRREGPGHTLQATELVHEAYLRLLGGDATECENRLHFFALAAQVMRRLLVDHARARRQLKRGGGLKVPLEEAVNLAAVRSDDLLAMHEALERLTTIDPRQGWIVELRYFAGLSVEEVATVLNISGRTVDREWRMAKAWLRAEMMGL